MQISEGTVVSIHYTLKNDAGELLDKSDSEQPFRYLHGHGNIVSGLEDALTGKVAGDTLIVAVAAGDGYGERDGTLVQDVPRGAFEGIEQIEAGMRFQAETEDGPVPVTVVQVVGDVVTVDGNHPLAGQTLHFDVEVAHVRSASEGELDHGHVHD